MKPLIVIPTYNERENIPKLLSRLLGMDPVIEVLVVDDNSPDGTAKLVEEYAQNTSRIHLLERPKKCGIGPAYIAGFQWALQQEYDVIMEMDADLSHDPVYVPQFFVALQTCDVVVGSRWVKGGRLADWPFSRVLLSRLANLYSQGVLNVRIRDWTAGFVAYRRAVLEAINLEEIHSDGYSFQIEMKFRSLKNGFRVHEIPITFTDRKAGESKISRRIVLEALLMVVYLRLIEKRLVEPRGKAINPAPEKLYTQ